MTAIVVGSGIAAQQLSPTDSGLQLPENAFATARGIDITQNIPRMLLNVDLEAADIVITLIRDVEIEVPDGVREETWILPDSASWGPQHLEPLVDHVSARTDDLVTRLVN